MAATGTLKDRTLDALGLRRPELRAWAMYDWGISAYETTIVTAVFPIYFGGGVLLALNLAWIRRPDLFGLPSGEGLTVVQETLPTAVWC